MENDLYLNEQIFKEIQERSNREKNVILIGIPEQSSPSAGERISKDESDIWNITSSIVKDIPKPARIFRIGKYSPGKNRKIKICYETSGPAKQLLRNQNKLPQNIKIYCDQTPAQQKYLSKLRDELSRRQNNGENELTIKYINGTPTIVKSTPKNGHQ